MQTVARMCLPMIAAVTAALPRNEHVADQFDLLADLMELDGADSFRVSAYRKAAQRIRETPGPVAQMALEGRAKGLQGIGKTIEGKIVEIVEDGEIHALTKKKATVTSELAEFARLPRRNSSVGSQVSARARRRRSSPRWLSRRRRRGRDARSWERHCRSCAPSSTCSRSTRLRTRSRSRGRHGGIARPCATSTSSRRPRIHPR